MVVQRVQTGCLKFRISNDDMQIGELMAVYALTQWSHVSFFGYVMCHMTIDQIPLFSRELPNYDLTPTCVAEPATIFPRMLFFTCQRF
jgi:hypothetical protein